MQILVFLGRSVLDLAPMYATDRRQTSSDVRRASLLNASAVLGRRHNKRQSLYENYNRTNSPLFWFLWARSNQVARQSEPELLLACPNVSFTLPGITHILSYTK